MQFDGSIASGQRLITQINKIRLFWFAILGEGIFNKALELGQLVWREVDKLQAALPHFCSNYRKIIDNRFVPDVFAMYLFAIEILFHHVRFQFREFIELGAIINIGYPDPAY